MDFLPPVPSQFRQGPAKVCKDESLFFELRKTKRSELKNLTKIIHHKLVAHLLTASYWLIVANNFNDEPLIADVKECAVTDIHNRKNKNK